MIDKYSMAKFLGCWATEDESWVFFDPHLTKTGNKAWLAPDQKCPRLVQPQLTNRKALIILAFIGDRKFSVALSRPKGTINAKVYIDFIQSTGERWRKLHTNPIKLCELWWQHANARPHTARATMEYLKRRDMMLIKQSPYSPDLNQCDR
ncbi:Transposase [Oopsacas minuta]|uniref:Transposase n=1 Tax=Oopsacas minuta TaxID=111878 RepID=A0AAV7JXC7_9METZ|nr:Transposase [Oopsacas minuta]